MRQLLIIGASGHGKVVADIAVQNGYKYIAFLDDNEFIKNCGEYPVIGRSKDSLLYSNSDFIVAIGNSKIREDIQNRLLNSRLNVTTLIHPNAVIASDVHIGIGTVIMAGAVVNSGTLIGNGCIINTCASVDHDCKIEDFVHVAVGSHLAGTVTIGKRTWIGAGATISNNIGICNDCMVGAGTVVIRDILEKCTVVGNPARILN